MIVVKNKEKDKVQKKKNATKKGGLKVGIADLVKYIKGKKSKKKK